MTRRTAISSLSRETMNPYLSRLYEALAREGVPRGPDAELGVRWLVGNRATVRWLHAHWPYSLYRWHRGPARLRGLLSWTKLALFVGRLGVARALGYRIVWTIHQVYPHDSADRRLDRAGLGALARAADVLLAHDAFTATTAARELGLDRARVTVVPHGNYTGAYPAGRPREVVRGELGAAPDDCVLVCFGELRGDSDVDVLLDAFKAVPDSSVRLVIAGNVKDRAALSALESSRSDGRILQRRGFVPFESVAELYGAADAAIVPRGNGGTSGSLILALSLGVPAIAADAPTYRELTADGEAAWLFEPGSPTSLAQAIRDAAGASAERERKAAAAVVAASALDWAASAQLIARALEAA
jgi:glycosyltransferase involved in cell wall biosynthesis